MIVLLPKNKNIITELNLELEKSLMILKFNPVFLCSFIILKQDKNSFNYLNGIHKMIIVTVGVVL